MKRLFLPVFAALLVCLASGTPAQSFENADEMDQLKKAEARARADEYASQRDPLAQDKIIDPEEYIIGPGDELTIFFYGGYSREERLKITPEGTVLVPEFGQIELGQISLAEAKRQIMDALSKRYTNVEISITLSRLRMLKVSVDGLVNFPGLYTVSSADRVTDAIKLAGEIIEEGSRRNIRLIRNGQVRQVDLLLYSRVGDARNNPYLIEGDKIYVPPAYDNIGTVEIYGAVRQQGRYEFVQGERIDELVKLAGGLTIDANPSSAELYRFNDEDDSIISIDLDLNSILENPGGEQNLLLQSDDRLFIRSIPGYHDKARATIEGEVLFPGVYAIKEDTTTLTELIARAGGFTAQASLAEARMYRYGFEAIKDTELDRQIKLSTDKLSDIEREYLMLRSDPDQGRVAIDFQKLFSENNEHLDVVLKDRDRIIIPRLSKTVRVMGRVLIPGLVTYRNGADIDYYVEKAGGFTKSADKGEIRIVKGTTGTIVKPSSRIRIEVGDEILVPEKRDVDWWQVTKDVGLFLANLATVYIVIDQIVE